MNIVINKRIDLQEIIKHTDWKDTYVTVRTLSMKDIESFTREQKQVQRKQERVQRDHEKYSKLLEQNPDDTALREHVQKLEDEVDANEYALFDYFTQFIQSRFVSGQAYNSDTSKVEPLQAEHIRQFNMGVLQEIIQAMMGAEKKS